MWLLFIFNTKEKKGRGWSKKSENVLASVIYGWSFTNKLVHSKYYEHYRPLIMSQKGTTR